MFGEDEPPLFAFRKWKGKKNTTYSIQHRIYAGNSIELNQWINQTIDTSSISNFTGPGWEPNSIPNHRKQVSESDLLSYHLSVSHDVTCLRKKKPWLLYRRGLHLHLRLWCQRRRRRRLLRSYCIDGCIGWIGLCCHLPKRTVDNVQMTLVPVHVSVSVLVFERDWLQKVHMFVFHSMAELIWEDHFKRSHQKSVMKHETDK